MERGREGTVARCAATTREGAACTRRATHDGRCRQHAGTAFYARVLPHEERASYEEALAQEGLAGEVAVLRLHLLRLVGRDDQDQAAEIPRTVHALVRALRDSRQGETDPIAALDAAVREEGRRLLGEALGEPGAATGPAEQE